MTIAVSAFSRLLKIIGLIAKEPYKRDDILSVSAFSFCRHLECVLRLPISKRPMILRSLLIIATPYCSSWLLHWVRLVFVGNLSVCCGCLSRQQKLKTCLPMKTTHVDQQQQTEQMSTKFRILNICLQTLVDMCHLSSFKTEDMSTNENYTCWPTTTNWTDVYQWKLHMLTNNNKLNRCLPSFKY